MSAIFSLAHSYWPFHSLHIEYSSEYGSYYDPCDQTIHIAQDDRRDRDVIMHEYGHYVADANGFAMGDVGDNPGHYWNADLRSEPVFRSKAHARNLAFRESWASLFSIATQYEDIPGSPNSGDTKYQDLDEETGEEFSIDLEQDSVDRDAPGEYYENMNCCTLWDIFDDHDDWRDLHDGVSDVSLVKIWTVFKLRV